MDIFLLLIIINILLLIVLYYFLIFSTKLSISYSETTQLLLCTLTEIEVSHPSFLLCVKKQSKTIK